MGSLHEEVKGIDESLGGLVWVRRRNGRWWPGRILGTEELQDSAPSPKPGIAIKLLGKEEESVDWYDLEKSTCVKAFRCGEYHECIEKAEVAASNSSRKTGKHARTEDAILHALEIERACLGKDHPSTDSEMTNQGNEVEDSPRSFNHNGEETNTGDSENESDSAEGLSLSGVSFQDQAYTDAHKEKTVERTSKYSDNDGTEGVKHMEGLNNLRTPVITSSKRKRFQVPHVRDFLKRKHRRCTVKKKLKSKIMVTVPVVYEKLAHPTRSLPQGASNRKVSQLSSDAPKINLSLKDTDLSSDDGLHDVCIVTEEQHYAGGTMSDESRQVKPVSLGESDSTSSVTAEANDIVQGVDNGISKWRLKRKRSRHTNKNIRLDLQKFTDVYDEFDAYVAGAEHSVDHNTSRGSRHSDNSTHPLKSRGIAGVKIDKEQGWSGNTAREDADGSRASAEQHTEQNCMPHRESHFSVNSKYLDRLIAQHTAKDFLFDVNLVVKANYRPQQVPFVSLSCKVTGQSVVGHPLSVEVLEDGFCDNLLCELGLYSSSDEWDEELDETTSALGGGKLDQEARSNSVWQVPLKQNVTPSKSTKYVLSKKIRKLSSLAGAREEDEEEILILEKIRGPSLACVPLTAVFSGLSEALNCPNRPTLQT